TKVPGAIHAFVNVFLSGIHSRLEQDLRIYLSPWHVSLLLSFVSSKIAPRMAFASSLFCSSKFLEHTHSNQTPHCASMFRQHQGRTYPFRFRFLAHFTLMLDLFILCQNIGRRYRRGEKKLSSKTKTQFLFFFAPPSEWRPRRPPIPCGAPFVKCC